MDGPMLQMDIGCILTCLFYNNDKFLNFIKIEKWQVLLIEAGQHASHIMDVPLSAILLQATTINWKYRTVPMNTSCLST